MRMEAVAIWVAALTYLIQLPCRSADLTLVPDRYYSLVVGNTYGTGYSKVVVKVASCPF